MAKKEKSALGIDLGGTNIKFGIVTEKGKILKKLSIKTEAEKGPERIIENIKTGINELISPGQKNKIEGIGIGSPGIVSLKKGTVENPPNLPGWNKVNLGKIISKEFKIPVHVENDANAAAIGELIFGSGKKYNSFIMVTLGTGVGGGIVINRKIYRGEFGAAGEIGHVTIDFKGPKCNCGSYGCVETYVGNQYLKNRIREELKNHPDSVVWKIVNYDIDNVSPRIIQQALEMNDIYAGKIVSDLGLYLGAALTSLTNTLDITVFIIGGGVAGFGAPLLSKIRDTIASRAMPPLQHRIKVVAASLRNEAGIKGASALVFYQAG
ncbi:MAG: ROK family protein [Ignavibacteriaceae bacterium]